MVERSTELDVYSGKQLLLSGEIQPKQNHAFFCNFRFWQKSVLVIFIAPGYLGCFNDCVGPRCSRALPVGPLASNNGQCSEWCFKQCLDRQPVNYKYAGLEYEFECFCGNNDNYDMFGERPESECADPCRGNSNQKCGDGNRLSVYRSKILFLSIYPCYMRRNKMEQS